MHGSDLQLGRELIRTFNLPQLSLWSEFQNIDKTLDRIGSYDLVIGQRLHSAVLACGLGVPAISLAYRPKCDDFMESIGRQNFALRTDQAGVDTILALMDDITANYAEHCQQTAAACDRLRQLQRQAVTQVLGLISVGTEARSASGQDWIQQVVMRRR
jgi:polysaccharide pyruvyl transferase WcaK-like protein